MSEEKIIYGVLSLMEALYNSMLHGTDCHLHLFNVPKYKEALQGLLDLYKAENEKNKALKEGLKYRINYCKLLEKELYGNGVNYEFEKTEIEKQFLEE